jgi:hypothetical protein
LEKNGFRSDDICHLHKKSDRLVAVLIFVQIVYILFAFIVFYAGFNGMDYIDNFYIGATQILLSAIAVIIYIVSMQICAKKFASDSGKSKDVDVPHKTDAPEQRPSGSQLSAPQTSANADFVSIVKKICSERDFSVFEDFAKCKSLLQDYTAGNFKKESRLLLLAIEAGCPVEITRSTEPKITKSKLINKLHNEFAIETSTAEQVVNLLYAVYNER